MKKMKGTCQQFTTFSITNNFLSFLSWKISTTFLISSCRISQKKTRKKLKTCFLSNNDTSTVDSFDFFFLMSTFSSRKKKVTLNIDDHTLRMIVSILESDVYFNNSKKDFHKYIDKMKKSIIEYLSQK